MADQPQTPPATPPASPPTGEQPQGEQPGPVPYDRFKEVNESNKALKARLAEIEAAQKTAKEKELAEQNQWKTLAEQHEQELKSERLTNAKLRVATQKGLSAELIDRLQGTTEEELAADADKLLALIKPTETPAPRAPGVPPSRGSQPARLDISTMTPEEIRKNRDKLYQQANAGR